MRIPHAHTAHAAHANAEASDYTREEVHVHKETTILPTVAIEEEPLIFDLTLQDEEEVRDSGKINVLNGSTRTRIYAPPTRLPAELWQHIFAHLTYAALLRAGAVCQAWNKWSQSPRLWRDLCERHGVDGSLAGMAATMATTPANSLGPYSPWKLLFLKHMRRRLRLWAVMARESEEDLLRNRNRLNAQHVSPSHHLGHADLGAEAAQEICFQCLQERDWAHCATLPRMHLGTGSWLDSSPLSAACTPPATAASIIFPSLVPSLRSRLSSPLNEAFNGLPQTSTDASITPGQASIPTLLRNAKDRSAFADAASLLGISRGEAVLTLLKELRGPASSDGVVGTSSTSFPEVTYTHSSLPRAMIESARTPELLEPSLATSPPGNYSNYPHVSSSRSSLTALSLHDCTSPDSARVPSSLTLHSSQGMPIPKFMHHPRSDYLFHTLSSGCELADGLLMDLTPGGSQGTAASPHTPVLQPVYQPHSVLVGPVRGDRRYSSNFSRK
jgi:hypothetical protein